MRRPGFGTKAALALWAALVYVFLFAPIVTAAVYSFNKGAFGQQTDTLTGLTTAWYPFFWHSGVLRHCVAVSLRVALISVAISVFFGTQAGLVLARQRGRIVRSLELLIYLLLLVPEIVLAVASLLFVVRLRIPLGIVPLAAAHSSFSIAVIALIVRARALMIDPATEESSADLGAGAMRTFWSVTLPQLRPAVVAGAILAFTFSFDNLVISLFLTTPTVTTLPVYIFGNAHNGLTPDLYAVTTTLMAFTLLTIALFAVVYRWQQRDLGDKRSFTDVLTAKAPASAVPA